MAKRWEYKIVTPQNREVTWGEADGPLRMTSWNWLIEWEDEFQELGREGWEFISSSPSIPGAFAVAYFRRELY